MTFSYGQPNVWNDRFERELAEERGEMYYQNEEPLTVRRMREMPKISEKFSGNYLKALDLKGKMWTVKVEGVREEELNGEMKLVAYFEGWPKGLVMNKTNAQAIAAMHGDDTDDWAGKKIKIHPDKTHFGGELVDCIRVKYEMEAGEAGEDEIPF